MKNSLVGVSLVCLLGFGAYVAFADDRPAEGSKPLSEVALTVEKLGYVIYQAEHEDDVWEIDAYRGDAKFDIEVDAKTGKVLLEKPD